MDLVENVSNNPPTERALLYHATALEKWELIRAAGYMKPSTAESDWLGIGVYFWQSAPIRAWVWKTSGQYEKGKRANPDECVVLEYALELTEDIEIIDLLDEKWNPMLAKIGPIVIERWKKAGMSERKIQDRLEKNSNNVDLVPRFLDRAAIEELCRRLEDRPNPRVAQVVRSAFQHLAPTYPYSGFHLGDHVQVAIRDTTLIDVNRLRVKDGLEKPAALVAAGKPPEGVEE